METAVSQAPPPPPSNYPERNTDELNQQELTLLLTHQLRIKNLDPEDACQKSLRAGDDGMRWRSVVEHSLRQHINHYQHATQRKTGDSPFSIDFEPFVAAGRLGAVGAEER